MERGRLICSLIGFFIAKHPNSDANDLKIMVDNHLVECHLTPIGTEPEDTEILQDLLDEVSFSTLARSNRSERRAGGIRKIRD